MARKAKSKTNGADGKASASGNAGHNVAGLKKIIRECAQQMRAIKAQRAELNEEAATIRERLKNAGVQTKAFEYALKVADMEAEAQASYTDSLRLAAEALSIGEQLDWVKAVHEKQQQAAKAESELDLTTINQEGVKAGLAGEDQGTNPYPDDSEAHHAWDQGWMGGQKQLAVKQGKKAAVETQPTA